MSDILYFDEIKEHRGGYFVQYQPPSADTPFATMNLVYFGSPENSAVSADMEGELREWLNRYPVPLMIHAWDSKENMIRPIDDQKQCLVGWLCPDGGEVVSSWKHEDLGVFLKSTPSRLDWRTIYADVPFKTDAQVKANTARYIEERKRQNRYLKAILFGWLAIIPAGIALFQYFGPEWLGLLALFYGLGKAGRAGYRLWRNSKPAPWEEAKAEKQRKMDHYYYHCERNLNGFERLKVENYEKEAAERIRKEAEALTKNVSLEKAP